ncbi:MAG: hypothetical protein V1743_04045 [Nanoarchaeota archaeon]
MRDKLMFWFSLLILFIISAHFSIIFYYTEKDNLPGQEMTGQTIADLGGRYFSINPADIDIRQKDLTPCCSFTVQGTVKSCYALQKYGCEACGKVCRK